MNMVMIVWRHFYSVGSIAVLYHIFKQIEKLIVINYSDLNVTTSTLCTNGYSNFFCIDFGCTCLVTDTTGE